MLDLDHQACARRSTKHIVSYTDRYGTRTCRRKKETRFLSSPVRYLRFQGEREGIASDRLFSGGSEAHLPPVVSSSETKSASLVNGLFMHLPTSSTQSTPNEVRRRFCGLSTLCQRFMVDLAWMAIPQPIELWAEVKPGCIERESISFLGQTAVHCKS